MSPIRNNLEVNQSIAELFSDWLIAQFKKCFSLMDLARRSGSRQNLDEDNHSPVQLWTIHYQLSDREAYDSYIDNHAEEMRTDGLERFGGQFQANRRLLYRESTYAL